MIPDALSMRGIARLLGTANTAGHVGPLWVAVAAAPIAIAGGISYREILPFRISILGLPLSPLDVLMPLLLGTVFLTAGRARTKTSPLLWIALALIVLGLVVGLLRANSVYYLVRDLRAMLYLACGVYLGGVISADPRLAPIGLRWLVLSSVLAALFQWSRFISGLSHGEQAALAGSGVLRDATIYQYTYALAFGVIAATFGTQRRVFRDGIGLSLLCLIAITSSITLSRSAWLAVGATAVCAALIPSGRSVLLRSAILATLLSAALPWIFLGAIGSPLATLPVGRLSVANDVEGALSGPAPSRPQQSEGPTATDQSTALAPAQTAPPTLSGRFSMAGTALSEMSVAASAPAGWTVWVVGFGFGHYIESYTFAFGETAYGVTDIENAPIHFLWKLGVVGLALVVVALGWKLLTAVRRFFSHGNDPLIAGWMVAVVSVLTFMSITGLGGAPYTMVIGGWLALGVERLGLERSGMVAPQKRGIPD